MFMRKPATARPSKYRNRKVVIDGVTFDSKAEASRFGTLKLRERIGEITDLELQVRFPLVVNGTKVTTYVADFRYREVSTGAVIVEDVKGVRTPVYKLKKKLMQAVHGIEVVEID